ncbi:PREDICTED: interferon-induced protein 44-like [Myotis davidii]|uniref:interferon-induced protein 44-like n=1 Tax=Myotis davidii TaxID=225400 RepID=UPI0003EC5C89|nr:PREDICTED: interferon-induced protein 44-like [Myotis davidii]
MAVTTRLTWNEEKTLQKLLGNVSLSLLYKSSVHECSIGEMLDKCAHQGPTITVIYFPTSIVGVFLLGNYPQKGEYCRHQNSFYFSLKTETTKFLNVKPEIVSEKLEFYSSNNIILSLIPHNSQVFIHPSLKVPGGIKYLKTMGYLECEVFRVEGIKNSKGYIRRITGVAQFRNKLLSELRAYTPCTDLVSEVNILLLGPVGSGKSSFFNSVKSVFRGHVTRQAAVGSDVTSITELYRMYSIQDEKDGKSLPFTLCDTMGLDEKEGVGLCMDDIPHILKGCVPDRYHFRPQQPITSSHPTFIISPSLKDRIHCVAYVLDINCIDSLSFEMVAKFKQVQKIVLNYGVPQVALLTKVKNYHGVLQEDFLNMNNSMTSQSQIMEIQAMLKIPISNILVVENYAPEWEQDPLKDVLILSALRQMLRAADDYLDDLPPGITDEVAGMSQLNMCN